MKSEPKYMRTVLDALIEALQVKTQYNRNDLVAPAAVLWPDRDGEWQAVMPLLRERLPALLELGDYVPAERRGPAIWLRCMLSRALPEANWDKVEIPILYLPGVSRQALRAIETCPKPLQPLAELQYRGEFFSQLNGKDWTVFAFLKSSDGGLGLDVAPDAETRTAAHRALTVLTETPVAYLQGRRLEAGDFDALLSPDPVRDLLLWLDDPERMRQQWDAERWSSLCTRWGDDFGFDAEAGGELAGAEMLGRAGAPWDKVWQRFAEAPQLYPNIPDLLRKATPGELFLEGHWPKLNDDAENILRKTLAALEDETAKEAIPIIEKLEQEHAIRRESVWAQLGQASLARALAPLSRLASSAGKLPAMPSLDKAAEWYAQEGWKADAAVLEALNCVRSAADLSAIVAAIRSLYGHWLDELAQLFQQQVLEKVYPSPEPATKFPAKICLLFVDGLRFDLGMHLKHSLEKRNFSVSMDRRWAALPTVTATAKPAQAPIAHLLSGDESGNEFRPLIEASGKPLNHALFHRLLQESNWRILQNDEFGDPTDGGRAWCEQGAFDRYGHDQGRKMAWRIQEEMDALVERIEALLEAGWPVVRIITDHGWLLLPGGLPRRELPSFLTTTRWGRCALLKPAASYSGPVVSWHWCDEMPIAMPVGAGVFYAGQEYAHGGLSLQECLLPVITVQPGEPTVRSVLQTPIWPGLRCRISVKNAQPGMQVDLRTKPADAASSIVKGGRGLDENGKAALLVEDDALEGTAVNLVLLDARGRVVAKQLTTVGGE